MQNALLIFYNILTYIDIVLYFGLTLLLLFKFGRFTRTLKLFTVFETMVFIISLASVVMGKLAIPNTSLFHVFVFAQLGLFIIYYYSLLAGTGLSIIIATTGIAAFVFFAAEYITNWNEVVSQLGGTLYFISNLLFIGYAIIYYIYTLTGRDKLNYPLINAAVLVYFSASSVIFLFGNQLKTMTAESQVVIWIFNVVIHILFIVLIFIDVWKTLYPNRKVL